MVIRKLIVAAIAVVGTIAGAAGVASAAPAVPFKEDYCLDPDTDPVTGTVYQYCRSAHGVVSSNETPSGNTKYSSKVHYTFLVTADGVLVQEGSGKGQYMYHQKGSDPQVVHSNGSYEDFFFGVTCTVKYNSTEANGKVRHDRSYVTCV